MVLVRHATAADAAACLALFERVAAEGKWIAAEAPVDRVRWREGFDHHLREERATTLVAEAEGQLVGSLGVEVGRHGVADFGMLVAPEWRRRGVGRALLTACLDWARAADAHKVSLCVWPQNVGARALYRRFGFEEEGRRRRHYRRRSGELWDVICMGLVLDDTSPGPRYADEEGPAPTSAQS